MGKLPFRLLTPAEMKINNTLRYEIEPDPERAARAQKASAKAVRLKKLERKAKENKQHATE